MEQNRKINWKDLGKRTAGTIAIPLLFFVVLFSICLGNGRMLISSSAGLISFLVSVTTITITTMALSINLNSGRFDFSLGSMSVLAMILSSKIVYPLLGGGTGSAILMLLFSVIIGAVLGLISGGIYCLLRIPPIITSLAITLIFEGISFTLTGGSYVMDEVRGSSMSFFFGQWWAILLLLAIAMAFVIFMFDHTSFGYRYQSLRTGQKLAVNQGIKEIPNALACYGICGGLMGIVGFLQAGITTSVNGGSLNFASIAIMFTAFLPMFIGGYIGRFSNDKLGYFLAGLSMGMLNAFFSTFHNEIDVSVQSIINAVLLVLFLIYLANEQKIIGWFKKLFSKKNHAPAEQN